MNPAATVEECILWTISSFDLSVLWSWKCSPRPARLPTRTSNLTGSLHHGSAERWSKLIRRKQGCAPENLVADLRTLNPMIKDCLMLQDFSFYFCLLLLFCYLTQSDACSSSSIIYCLSYVFKQLFTSVNQFSNDSKCNLLVLNIRWLKLKIEPPTDYSQRAS